MPETQVYPTYSDYGFDQYLNRDNTEIINELGTTEQEIEEESYEVSNVDLAGGTIRIGSQNTVLKSDADGLYLGNADFASAPFRVSMAGALVATSATITGSITATTGTIGGWTIGANSISAGSGASTVGLDSTVTGGDDIRVYAGSATLASAPFRVTEAGVVTATNITITGGSVDTTVLSGTIAQSNLNVASRGWVQTCAFSVTDADTVAWGAGTFTSADGTAYSISGSNTGNMAAKTYIYLDIAVSTTAYQTTTTATTAVGVGKVLTAIAQNGTGEATFQVLSGQGGQNIDAANIVVGSITGNEIAASTITSGLISVAQLSAISADMGAITAGTITGGIVQTSASASTGIKFTSTAIQGFNASNIKTFELLASSGALVYEGYLGKIFTAGETLAANDAVYVKSSDGKVYKTDSDFSDERITRWIGFAVAAITLGNAGIIAIDGVLGGFTLTAGDDYFLSGTAGAVTNAPGTYFQSVGFAVSSTELLIGENFAIDESSNDTGIAFDPYEYSATMGGTPAYVLALAYTFSAGSFYNITTIKFDAKCSISGNGQAKTTYQAGSGTETLITETTGILSTYSTYTHTTTVAKNTDKDDNLVIRLYIKGTNTTDTTTTRFIKAFGTKAIRI